MINDGLLALVELMLPHEILKSFAVAQVENTPSMIRIHLDELPCAVCSDTNYLGYKQLHAVCGMNRKKRAGTVRIPIDFL